jgi:hypothetical protein
MSIINYSVFLLVFLFCQLYFTISQNYSEFQKLLEFRQVVTLIIDKAVLVLFNVLGLTTLQQFKPCQIFMT